MKCTPVWSALEVKEGIQEFEAIRVAQITQSVSGPQIMVIQMEGARSYLLGLKPGQSVEGWIIGSYLATVSGINFFTATPEVSDHG